MCLNYPKCKYLTQVHYCGRLGLTVLTSPDHRKARSDDDRVVRRVQSCAASRLRQKMAQFVPHDLSWDLLQLLTITKKKSFSISIY